MPRPHRIVPILSLLLACTGDASDSGADAAPEDLTQSLPNPGLGGHTTTEMTYADTVTGTDKPLPRTSGTTRPTTPSTGRSTTASPSP